MFKKDISFGWFDAQVFDVVQLLDQPFEVAAPMGIADLDAITIVVVVFRVAVIIARGEQEVDGPFAKIHHIVPKISDPAAGPSFSVPPLCQALAQLDHEVVLHVLAPIPEQDWGRLKVAGHRASSWSGRLQGSSEMKAALRVAAGEAQVMHNHSLWTLANVYPGHSIRGTNCRLVFSPRGTMDPWACSSAYDAFNWATAWSYTATALSFSLSAMMVLL